jgi:hypothetical protein
MFGLLGRCTPLFVVFALSGCLSADNPAPDASARTPPLTGLYKSTTPGELSSINFYDGSHYFVRRATCPEPDDSCVVHGTYQVDPSGTNITLQDDGAPPKTIALDVSTTSDAIVSSTASSGQTPRSLHPLDGEIVVGYGSERLVTPMGCLIVRRVQLAGQGMDRQQDTDAFKDALLAQVTAKPVPLDVTPGWVNDAASSARAGCTASLDLKPGSLTWNGIDLVSIPSCPSSGSSPNYAIFTRNQTRVGQFNLLPNSSTDYKYTSLVPPDALLDIAKSACH